MDSLINGLETEIRGNKNKGELFKNMLLQNINYNVTLIMKPLMIGTTRMEI